MTQIKIKVSKLNQTITLLHLIVKPSYQLSVSESLFLDIIFNIHHVLSSFHWTKPLIENLVMSNSYTCVCLWLMFAYHGRDN